MKKIVLLLPALFFTFIFSACSSSSLQNQHNFVKVNGTHFEVGGKPFYYTGTNFWSGCYLGVDGKSGDRARLVRELDRLKAAGITNLRIFGASEVSYIGKSLKPAIQQKPGVYDEIVLEGLDFLLAEMGKRDMRAVVFLNNYWEWTGGMSQYNAWANGANGPDLSKADDYGPFMDYSATFYKNEKAQKLFLNYVDFIVHRKNTITGVLYMDDPTIMAWQLANEPRPGRNTDLLKEFYAWMESASAYIHSIDKNHLVSSGNEGLAGCLQDSVIFLTSHKTKNIDYLTFHLWPKNWGWFDAKNIEKTYAVTEKNAVTYINQHINYGALLNKPIVMEEFGLPRDSELCKIGTPTTARDKYYKKILGLIADSAASGASISGTNFWAWGGEGRGQHPDDKWQPGDQLVGDPPQEPQGLNSIFDVDLSTMTILKEHAARMEALNHKK